MDGDRDILEEIDMEIDNLGAGVRNVVVNEVVQNQIPQGRHNNEVNQAQPVVNNIAEAIVAENVQEDNYNNVHQAVGNEGVPVDAENEGTQAALVPVINENPQALENENAPGNEGQKNQNLENNYVVGRKQRGTRAGWQKKFYYVQPYDKGQHRRVASIISELANMDQPNNPRQNQGNYIRRGGAQGGRGNNGAGRGNGPDHAGNGVAQGGRGNNGAGHGNGLNRAGNGVAQGGPGNNGAGHGNGAGLGIGGRGNDPNRGVVRGNGGVQANGVARNNGAAQGNVGAAQGNVGVARGNDVARGNGAFRGNGIARGGRGRGQQ